MDLYTLWNIMDNVNTRSVNPSGGAGIHVQKPAGPQKKMPEGGAFGGGYKALKNSEIKPSPFNVTSKDNPVDLKQFNLRPAGISGKYPLTPFKPKPGMLGNLGQGFQKQNTNIKQGPSSQQMGN